ncbi:MAG: DUF2807 domain-containing protein [Alphaproteobacteria bacterium]|nr:DUF2807 domain-containing protein [Alphaproteobacteria bacterium]
MALSAAQAATFAAFTGLVIAGASAHAETRRVNNITNISSIEAEGRFRIEIVSGATAGATLTGAPDDVARVGIRYRDGDIRFWEKCTVFCGNQELDVVVRIVAPQLTSLELSKGVEATATGLSAQTLSVDLAMGASLRATGQCDTLEADVAMGGALSAENLACRRVVVDAAMGGSADVRASAEAEADASMGGAITIYGNPPRIDSSGSMGGTISTPDQVAG